MLYKLNIFHKLVFLAVPFLLSLSPPCNFKVVAQTSPNNHKQSVTIKINKINIVGNTVFSDRELKKVLDIRVGSEINYEELERLRQKIDKLYLDKGYLGSGSLLFPQDLSEGKVTFLVIEGILEEIQFKGLRSLKEAYLRAHLPIEGSLVNAFEIAEALKKLKKDALVKDIEATTVKSPNKQSNKYVLLVDVVENKATTISFNGNNAYSPSVGNWGGTAGITSLNLLGLRDRANLEQSYSGGLSRTNFSYSVPLNVDNMRLNFSYTSAKSEFIQEEIKNFGIEADYQAFKLELESPIIARSDRDLAIGVSFELIDSESFILGDLSFAFVEGLPDGQTNLSILRLWQNYQQQWGSSYFNISSQFSLGLDVFDATQTELGIDSLYWSWIGALSYAKAYDRFFIVNDLTLQLTPDKLFPLEQVNIGGYPQVRGYRTNLVSADNGLINSFVIFFPIFEDKKYGKLDLGSFVDFGVIWNSDRALSSESNTFASVGLSVQYEIVDFLRVRLDYGLPIIKAEGFGGTDTDNNVLFSISIIPIKF